MLEEKNGEGWPEELQEGSPTDEEDGEASGGKTKIETKGEETFSELLSELVLIEREDWEVVEAIGKIR